MRKAPVVWGAVCFLAVAASAAQAAIHNFSNFPINGNQPGTGLPPTGSPATGVGNVTYDDVTNQLNWNISWSGLLGTVSNAHFHGPLPATGVQVGIPFAVNPAIGNAVITDTQESQLLGLKWYVNIHSTAFPGGEISGLVIPEPASLGLLGMGSLVLVRRRRRTV